MIQCLILCRLPNRQSACNAHLGFKINDRINHLANYETGLVCVVYLLISVPSLYFTFHASTGNCTLEAHWVEDVDYHGVHHQFAFAL